MGKFSTFVDQPEKNGLEESKLAMDGTETLEGPEEVVSLAQALLGSNITFNCSKICSQLLASKDLVSIVFITIFTNY